LVVLIPPIGLLTSTFTISTPASSCSALVSFSTLETADEVLMVIVAPSILSITSRALPAASYIMFSAVFASSGSALISMLCFSFKRD
jgi:hypothetical protein